MFISLGALAYLTLLVLHVRQPWVYLGILILTTSFSVGKSYQRNGWKSRFFWFVILAVVPYATWACVQVVHGKFGAGLDLFLFGFDMITGALYYRQFRSLSPGVLLTSVSFMAWGSVFPVAKFLASHQIFLNAAVWDLPKYFVAFGMILSLFEGKQMWLWASPENIRRSLKTIWPGCMFRHSMESYWIATPHFSRCMVLARKKKPLQI